MAPRLKQIAISFLILSTLAGVWLYPEMRQARVNRFMMLRQQDLQKLGATIEEYAQAKGRFPNSFNDLIESGKIPPDSVDFIADGHRVTRIYVRPQNMQAARDHIMVIESYDSPDDRYNVLTADGYVYADLKKIHPISKWGEKRGRE